MVGEVARVAGGVFTPSAADSLAGCVLSELRVDDPSNRRNAVFTLGTLAQAAPAAIAPRLPLLLQVRRCSALSYRMIMSELAAIQRLHLWRSASHTAATRQHVQPLFVYHTWPCELTWRAGAAAAAVRRRAARGAGQCGRRGGAHVPGPAHPAAPGPGALLGRGSAQASGDLAVCADLLKLADSRPVS